MRAATVAGIAALAACRDVTPPHGNAVIVFQRGNTCTGTAQVQLVIDDTVAGVRSMAPGDTAAFEVAPGEHSAGALAPGTDGATLLWFPQVVTLLPKQRYTQTLGCGQP